MEHGQPICSVAHNEPTRTTGGRGTGNVGVSLYHGLKNQIISSRAWRDTTPTRMQSSPLYAFLMFVAHCLLSVARSDSSSEDSRT